MKVKSSSSISLAERVVINEISSGVLFKPISDKTGTSLTGETLNVNISESLNKPSLTVTKISTDPNQLFVGINVS